MDLLKRVFNLIKDTYTEWNEDGAPMLAAALAYYTAFSIAPLIILVVAVVGLVASQDDIQTEILDQVTVTAGADAAELVNDLIDNSSKARESILSTIFGIGALLLGALGVFNHLQNALDRIWDVDEVERKSGVRGFVADKLLSFGMILVVGLLLLVSLVASTALSFADNYFSSALPASDVVLYSASSLLSFGITTLLFMFIYKFLPHAMIRWRDVWIGAMVTALLFTIGRTILGLYLGNSATTSSYGAAGAFVIILLWVYYSAQIILFGAEFTQVFARRYGSRIVPDGFQPEQAADCQPSY